MTPLLRASNGNGIMQNTILSRLGVGPVINARNWTSEIGGAPVDARVLAAAAEVGKLAVDMRVLLEKSGTYLSSLCRCDAAYITTGASAAMSLAVAACIAGDDSNIWNQMPHTSEHPNEVLVHVAHTQSYTCQWAASGARLVFYGQAGSLSGLERDLEGRITGQTRCVTHTISYNCPARDIVPLGKICEVAHRHGLPVIVDAAAMLPPIENLWKYFEEGADVVIFSGGKALRALGSTGLILSRGRGADLVKILQRHGYPNPGWGRGYKISKEQVVSLVRAVEIFLEEATTNYTNLLNRALRIKQGLENLSGLNVRVIPNDEHYHEHPLAPRVPRVLMEWDIEVTGFNAAELDITLRTEKPEIFLKERHYADYYSNKAWRIIDTYCLNPEQDDFLIKKISSAVISLTKK
jgi:D-glucosaminate-6-phosphate ammonia-lyase